jgi:hypothetical protein
MTSEIERLKERLGTCVDERGRPTDGGITLENPTEIDPKAKVAHLWKFGDRFVLSIVLQSGEVENRELSTMEDEPEERRLLIDGEPRPGVLKQVLKKTGLRGKKKWVSAGGEGNYFDLTEKETSIIEEIGAPVVVYPNGDVEPIEPDPRHKDNLDY